MRAVAVGIGVTLFLAIFIVVASDICMKKVPDSVAFDSNKWKRAGNSELRARMVGDLMQRHELVGMDREQVVSLLGSPDLRWNAPEKLIRVL